jgi:hypothetical protein
VLLPVAQRLLGCIWRRIALLDYEPELTEHPHGFLGYVAHDGAGLAAPPALTADLALRRSSRSLLLTSCT